MKNNVSINIFNVLAFLSNLNTRNILNIRMLVTLADEIGIPGNPYSMIITVSVTSTIMKSKIFHESLNYKDPSAICLIMYSSV